MKKIFFLSITILFMTMSLYSQTGLRVFNFQPLGKNAVYFKPGITAEMGYIEPFDTRFRKTAFLTIINLKTTIPEIPTTGRIHEDGNITVCPGYQKFDLFMMIQIRAGYDFALIKQEKWNTFIGANVLMGGSILEYKDHIELIGGIDLSTNVPGIGAQIRAGVDYQLTELFGVFFILNKGIYFSYSELISHTLWSDEFGLGFSYTF